MQERGNAFQLTITVGAKAYSLAVGPVKGTVADASYKAKFTHK